MGKNWNNFVFRREIETAARHVILECWSRALGVKKPNFIWVEKAAYKKTEWEVVHNLLHLALDQWFSTFLSHRHTNFDNKFGGTPKS
jgi:hypothetical protein